VRLLMAGDGPMRAELEARVAPQVRGPRRVHAAPSTISVRGCSRFVSLFLLPARAVGFSIMVLEAFAAGLPVVALPGLGTDNAGDHWANVIMARTAARGVRRRDARHAADATARAHRARGRSSPTRSTGRGRRPDPRRAQTARWAAPARDGLGREAVA
jgi:glycosyltransferase involved in cell wall biosynthesis